MRYERPLRRAGGIAIGVWSTVVRAQLSALKKFERAKFRNAVCYELERMSRAVDVRGGLGSRRQSEPERELVGDGPRI